MILPRAVRRFGHPRVQLVGEGEADGAGTF